MTVNPIAASLVAAGIIGEPFGLELALGVGASAPPTRIYMKALDLVASGPFSRKL